MNNNYVSWNFSLPLVFCNLYCLVFGICFEIILILTKSENTIENMMVTFFTCTSAEMYADSAHAFVGDQYVIVWEL